MISFPAFSHDLSCVLFICISHHSLCAIIIYNGKGPTGSPSPTASPTKVSVSFDISLSINVVVCTTSQYYLLCRLFYHHLKDSTSSPTLSPSKNPTNSPTRVSFTHAEGHYLRDDIWQQSRYFCRGHLNMSCLFTFSLLSIAFSLPNIGTN